MSDKWGPVLDAALDHLVIVPFSPWRALRYMWKHLHKFRGTVGAELRRLITDEHVRAALAGTLLYTGLSPDEMPVASILGLVAMLKHGVFLPEGGMGAIADALVTAFRGQGGQLRLASRVTRIVVESGRARAVLVNGRDRIDASVIVSTASPMSTFTCLVEPEDVPPSLTRKVQSARLSHRAVSLQFGLTNRLEAPALVNMVLPMLEQQHEVVAQDPANIRWPVYSAPAMALPELTPPGGSIIEMFVPVAPDVARRQWTETSKHDVIDSALLALGGRHRLDIAITRVRTPSDFRDQMNLYQGALYGVSPAVPPQQHFARMAPIPGLVLAGQSTYPGYGVGPAMMSGIFAGDAAMAVM